MYSSSRCATRYHWWIIYSLSILSTVACHGSVSKISIANKTYSGPAPIQDGNPPSRKDSVIRQIFYGDPILNTNDSSVACGIKSQLASELAPVLPGDQVGVSWSGEDGQSIWPHDTGPMFAYLTPCGNTSCTAFNASGAQWFKIAQSGQTTKGWGQANLTRGQPFVFNMPLHLEPGQYLLRNEVVNMGQASGGIVEIYVACAQLQLKGNETGRPLDSDWASFPGGYNQSDFLSVDPYDPSQKYTMPGPPIATIVERNSSRHQPPPSAVKPFQ